MEKKLELLAPAGSLVTLKAVVNAGADAVYLGGDLFGARAYANNFTKEELLEGIDYGHRNGCRVILAVNTLLKGMELKEHLYEYLLPYYEHGIDAVIVQDFGVFDFLHEQFPELPLHTSTQMTVTGVEGARFLAEKGAKRIVMARELSYSEIRKIHESVDVELESFVHGALCYCYSGQCLLSSMLGGRSGNRGRCAQPCRLPYSVKDEAGHLLGATENYILSPKDLCTIKNIPKLAECGIYSFKIEGRMKQAEYAAGVVSIYRKYMDFYLEHGASAYRVSGEDEQKLFDFGNRSGFTAGYYEMHNGRDMITVQKPNHTKGNEALQEEIRKKYIEPEQKEKIQGNLILKKEKPAMLKVMAGDIFVQVSGDAVQCAKNHPLLEVDVLKKIRKTGNTPYEFEKITVDLDEDIFLPIQSLNQLRRDALEALAVEQQKKYTRPYCGKLVLPEEKKADAKGGKKQEHTPYLAVSVETEEAFDEVNKAPFVKRIYVDSMLFENESLKKKLGSLVQRAKASGKEIYYIFPSVFRAETKARYESLLTEPESLQLDGFLIRSYDELSFCKSRKIMDEKLILDHNMYTYSDFAKRAFEKCGIGGDTAPVELNKSELHHRDNTNSELILYGYLPLMTSAQCVHKNMVGCDKKKGICFLRDRYKKEFAVKNNCNDCYNVIYNASPLSLLHQRAEIGELYFSGVRLQFTIEKKEKVKEILGLYQKIWLENKRVEEIFYLTDYTNGHFKRGVE